MIDDDNEFAEFTGHGYVGLALLFVLCAFVSFMLFLFISS